MVDRGKCAQQRQRDGQLDRRLRQAHADGGHADPDEKDDHHRAASPLIAELSSRQGPHAKKEEGRDAVGHQVFPFLEAEFGGDGGHRGGEDQQEHVVEGMTQVQQATSEAIVHPPILAQIGEFVSPPDSELDRRNR